MSATESSLPDDWFDHGDLDLQAAEILLMQGGPLSIVAFHLQQAIEKYLKGFLLAWGWPLRRVHDVELLIQEAIARDADFGPFLALCQKITEYYIETRYPVGVSSSFESQVLEAELNTAYTLVQLIRSKVKQG
ncbi:MAG: HEPN domain-containing protein [Chloroflexaceae bacterium]